MFALFNVIEMLDVMLQIQFKDFVSQTFYLNLLQNERLITKDTFFNCVGSIISILDITPT